MKANIAGFFLLLFFALAMNHCTGWTPGGSGNQYDRR